MTIKYNVKQLSKGFILEKDDDELGFKEYYGFKSRTVEWWAGTDYIDEYCIEANILKVKKIYNKLTELRDTGEPIDINNIKTGIWKYLPKVNWSWKN